ncbi:MAG TPA: hypothetical protein VMU39_00780 [Solirubrobacteraceae bacterium]|nr:hypothetical protein [Solirubrobacteraceae bacterium]
MLLGPTSANFAQELGHTLGLTHATGLGVDPPAPEATALGYPGIGAVGYQHIGNLTEVYDKARTADIMSYDKHTWTTPKSWKVMFEKIRAESGAIHPEADAAHTATAANQPVIRRLVTGILQGDHTIILDSPVTPATSPVRAGPTVARVVARDSRGHAIAQAPVRGTLVAEQGERRPSLPFVVALPDDKRIASLEVLPLGKGKPLAILRRSKHPPTGKLLRLPPRASAATPMMLRWRATDRDRGDRLSVAILARRGTGRFRTLLLGPATGSMVLDPRRLGKGKQLSVRLLVSDGLTTTVVNARPVALRAR